MRTLLIDNYDSFTFNLFQLLAEVNGEEPVVVRNDTPWSAVLELDFDNVVVSPGPGRPELEADFGISRRVFVELDVPVLGVCLGHQGLGFLSGASIVHAPEPVHGRSSRVCHNGDALFDGIPQKFLATRYHSLMVADDLPASLEKIAWTEDGIIMGLRHRHRPHWGVQFHPESVCTEYGRQLLANFRALTEGARPRIRSRREAPRAVPRRAQLETESRVYSRRLSLFVDAERVFLQLFAAHEHSFWLDSSDAALGLPRFSFMGAGGGPEHRLVRYDVKSRVVEVDGRGKTEVLHETIFDFLDRELYSRRTSSSELPFDFNCGFVGYLGYELKADSGGRRVHSSPLKDAQFLLADRMMVFDWLRRHTWLVCLGTPSGSAQWFDEIEARLRSLAAGELAEPQTPAKPSEAISENVFRLKRGRAQYLADIRECQRLIRDGETYEVCLTNQLHAESTLDPMALYRATRSANPTSHSAFLRFPDMAIVCSSPERFLRIDSLGQIEATPIKGTAPRGRRVEEDEALRRRLQSSEKDRAENLMIVDLLRNDLGRVCEVGSVHVPRMMDVESYATVHQLVSTIRGRLRSGMTAVDCIRAAFPGGSMTGAPKLRTMEIIDRLEDEARGVYSGALGYLSLSGAVDLNIVIRSAVFREQHVSIGIGGAIVALSDPESEFDEILLKAKGLMNAFAMAQGAQARIAFE